MWYYYSFRPPSGFSQWPFWKNFTTIIVYAYVRLFFCAHIPSHLLTTCQRPWCYYTDVLSGVSYLNIILWRVITTVIQCGHLDASRRSWNRPSGGVGHSSNLVGLLRFGLSAESTSMLQIKFTQFMSDAVDAVYCQAKHQFRPHWEQRGVVNKEIKEM